MTPNRSTCGVGICEYVTYTSLDGQEAIPCGCGALVSRVDDERRYCMQHFLQVEKDSKPYTGTFLGDLTTIVDEVELRLYANNRMLFPEIEPFRWAKIFPHVIELEERYQNSLVRMDS